MWSTSDRFLDAIRYPQKRKTVVTLTTPDSASATALVKAGGVSVDGSSRARRTTQGLRLIGDIAMFEMASTPGTLFQIAHGLVFGSSDELIPVFTGELTEAAQELGNGEIGCSLQDLSGWLARARFLTPFVALAGTSRIAAITNAVTAARPGTVVNSSATDTGVLGADQVWTGNPLDVIADLTTDGGTEAFFAPDGTFVIRDQVTTAAQPVWTATSGTGGVLKTAKRTRPLSRMYNTVCVRPSASDNSQTWSQQVAQVTDPLHPLHPSKVGVVPYFWASPTIQDANAALAVAYNMLDRILGVTESLSLTLVGNPALEANEAIRVSTPAMNLDPANTFQHFLDAFNFDLVSGDMSASTRRQRGTADA